MQQHVITGWLVDYINKDKDVTTSCLVDQWLFPMVNDWLTSPHGCSIRAEHLSATALDGSNPTRSTLLQRNRDDQPGLLGSDSHKLHIYEQKCWKVLIWNPNNETKWGFHHKIMNGLCTQNKHANMWLIQYAQICLQHGIWFIDVHCICCMMYVYGCFSI